MKKLLLMLSFLLTFTISCKRGIEGKAMNSPVNDGEAKFLLEQSGGEGFVKKIQYKLHYAQENPVSKPNTWQEVTFSKMKDGLMVTISVGHLVPGDYVAHFKIDLKNSKLGNQNVKISFKIGEVKDTEVPHPGEEGKRTLAGIDSDNDGIRDDIQIWINKTYPEDTYPSSNKALKQMAKYEQQALVAHQDKEKSKEFKIKSLEAYGCLKWVNESSSIEAQKELKYHNVNTPERIRAFYKSESHLHGQGLPLTMSNYDGWGQLCEFEPVKEH